MVFSSSIFIIFFLPILLILYFITPSKYRMYVLLFASLLFYFLGDPKNIIFLILSCIINYFISVFIIKNSKNKKIYLCIGIIYNVIQLFFFKYFNFFINNFNSIFNFDVGLINIIMPIGISFYTFQAISYIVDVYKNKKNVASNITEFMMYLTFFPQLIAGPIVRFLDIKKDIFNRDINFDNIYSGIKRFIIGLSKKVLIANVIGELITKFALESVLLSYIKPILYTLQIYYDFSGYSDMAIGLGLIFNFYFKENFNYPLFSKSITDFWHKWHISLSSWFRDYIYIPLGGNRVSKLKWIRNIFIVWILTGFWHGANWNFIIWGIYFCLILLIEKLFLNKFIKKTKVLKYMYSFIIISISFLIFSITDLSELINEFKNMLFINDISFINTETIFYLKDYLFVIVLALIGSTPLIKNIYLKIKDNRLVYFIEPILLIVLFLVSISFIVDSSYNPFLYFRF